MRVIVVDNLTITGWMVRLIGLEYEIDSPAIDFLLPIQLIVADILDRMTSVLGAERQKCDVKCNHVC